MVVFKPFRGSVYNGMFRFSRGKFQVPGFGFQERGRFVFDLETWNVKLV